MRCLSRKGAKFKGGQRLNSPTTRNRVGSAIAVFLVFIIVWMIVALQLNAASAGSLSIAHALRSRLVADYSSDRGRDQITSLRISIIGDVLGDQGLSPEEAEAQRKELVVALSSPVPSATAKGSPLDPSIRVCHQRPESSARPNWRGSLKNSVPPATLCDLQ